MDYRLIYSSKSNTNDVHNTVIDIIKKSISYNMDNDITGVLIHKDEYFLQTIEGNISTINSLYNKIVNDKRHSDQTILVFEPIFERWFKGWHMKSLGFSDLNVELVNYLEHKYELSSSKVNGFPVDKEKLNSLILDQKYMDVHSV